MIDDKNIEEQFIPPPLPTSDDDFVPPPLPDSKLDFTPPPLPQDLIVNVSQTAPQFKNPQKVKKMNHKKLMFASVVGVVVVLAIIIILSGDFFFKTNKSIKGKIAGDVIIVAGKTVYVVDEDTIIVPYYPSVGTYYDCSNMLNNMVLEGCKNPHLPGDELDLLPENTKELIVNQFRGICHDNNGNTDIFGFWTSIQHPAGSDYYYYATIDDGMLSIDGNGEGDFVSGFGYDGISSEATLGLVVVFDIETGFEFEEQSALLDGKQTTSSVGKGSATSSLSNKPAFCNDIGKTLSTLQDENPKMIINPLSPAPGIHNGMAQLFGEINGKYAYYFYSANGYPLIENILNDGYSNQLKCAGIYTTVGILFPKETESTTTSDFFKSINVSNYTYSSNDPIEPGIVEFEYNGYQIMIDYSDEISINMLSKNQVDIPPKNIKSSYNIFMVNKSIDNNAVLTTWSSRH